LQPSQMVWNRRIKLRLGHNPLFQLHKPGHRKVSTIKGLETQRKSAQKDTWL
jgi:hypothetical protein